MRFTLFTVIVYTLIGLGYSSVRNVSEKVSPALVLTWPAAIGAILADHVNNLSSSAQEKAL